MASEILACDDRFGDYLGDESRTLGWAESISFPENEAEVQTLLASLGQHNTAVTMQGSRTGICGSAVPHGGHIVNMSRMNDIVGVVQDPIGHFTIRVQPGLTIGELHRRLCHRQIDRGRWGQTAKTDLEAWLHAGPHFWPPDPTEDSASIGGMAATNAGGLTAHHYGRTRKYIDSIRIVDGSGAAYQIDRGQYLFSQGRCPHPSGLILVIDDDLSAGDAALDLLDLYLGSEGMFAAITELRLILLPSPKEQWAIVFFFALEDGAASFIEDIRQSDKAGHAASIVAVEFLDAQVLGAIRQLQENNSRLTVLPEIASTTAAAVYLELHGNESEQIEDLAAWLQEVSMHYGSDAERAWAFSGEQELARARLFRSAAPEAVNMLLDRSRSQDRRIAKLATDMHMPAGSFADVLQQYRMDLQKSDLRGAIFGHAADLHLHVNILPEDYAAFLRGQSLLSEWARKVSSAGGSVVGEHGVGKVKKYLFRLLPLPKHLAILRCLKRQLDPRGIFNPGNMFENNP